MFRYITWYFLAYAQLYVSCKVLSNNQYRIKAELDVITPPPPANMLLLLLIMMMMMMMMMMNFIDQCHIWGCVYDCPHLVRQRKYLSFSAIPNFCKGGQNCRFD